MQVLEWPREWYEFIDSQFALASGKPVISTEILGRWPMPAAQAA